MSALVVGQSACMLRYKHRRFIVREYVIDAVADGRFYHFAGIDEWHAAALVYAGRADAVAEAARRNALPVPEGSQG